MPPHNRIGVNIAGTGIGGHAETMSTMIIPTAARVSAFTSMATMMDAAGTDAIATATTTNHGCMLTVSS